MPHFCFVFTPSQSGCVERACVSTPWFQPQQTQQGPVDPKQLAYNYLMQYSNQRDGNNNPILFFAQNAKCECIVINPSAHTPPNVYCIQKAEPTADRCQVNAPYNMPLSNGQGLTMPPIASQEKRMNPGMYEPMHDSALPRTNDTLLGEMDGEGGTFTDYSPTTGTETVREYAMPVSPKVTGR